MRIARCKAGSNINVKNREKLLQDACHKSFENSNVSMEMYRKELLTILQCSFRSPGFNVALFLRLRILYVLYSARRMLHVDQ